MNTTIAHDDPLTNGIARVRQRWSAGLRCASDTRFAFAVSLLWLTGYNARFWQDTVQAMWHASASSALFFVSVAGKFLFGWLSDRFPPTLVMAGCCLVMFGSTLALLDLTPASVFAFLLPFGFGYGGTFVLLQRIAADFFGNRDYPRILGVLIVIETVGAAIGGLVTGRLADASGGDYTSAFYAVIAVSGLAFMLTMLLATFSGRPAK